MLNGLGKKYNPNFLLVHPMNVDDVGHKYGEESVEYRDSARKTDQILAEWIPFWREKGYKIL